jgi:HlyD family secretion protein
VLDANVTTQEERIALTEATWARDLDARKADVRLAQSAASLAARSWQRERELVSTGASTAQVLDDAEAARDQAASTLERAKQVLARTEAEERSIALARHELTQLRERRELLLAELAELEVTRAKYDIYAPAVATVVQTQFIWPGELAQPGTSILAVLDPVDKYVRVYVPVEESARLPVGQRVEIELDSEPGPSVPESELRRRSGQLHAGEDRDAARPPRPGLSGEGPHPRGARALPPGTEGNGLPLDGTHG